MVSLSALSLVSDGFIKFVASKLDVEISNNF